MLVCSKGRVHHILICLLSVHTFSALSIWCVTSHVIYVKSNIEARSRNHFCSGKAISIKFECVCSLRYPECKLLLFCVVLYSRLRSGSLYHIFPHYLINGAIIGTKFIELKMCFDFLLQLLSETFIIVRRSQRDIINVYRSSCKLPVAFSRFLSKLSFLDRL
jgi:hypothetical protein